MGASKKHGRHSTSNPNDVTSIAVHLEYIPSHTWSIHEAPEAVSQRLNYFHNRRHRNQVRLPYRLLFLSLHNSIIPDLVISSLLRRLHIPQPQKLPPVASQPASLISHPSLAQPANQPTTQTQPATNGHTCIPVLLVWRVQKYLTPPYNPYSSTQPPNLQPNE